MDDPDWYGREKRRIARTYTANTTGGAVGVVLASLFVIVIELVTGIEPEPAVSVLLGLAAGGCGWAAGAWLARTLWANRTGKDGRR